MPLAGFFLAFSGIIRHILAFSEKQIFTDINLVKLSRIYRTKQFGSKNSITVIIVQTLEKHV